MLSCTREDESAMPHAPKPLNGTLSATLYAGRSLVDSLQGPAVH
jgi:hypothetical protein